MTQYYLPPPAPEGMPTGFQGVVSENYEWIPPDPANRHWVEYQEWLAEGNEPLPYDQLPEPPQPKAD